MNNENDKYLWLEEIESERSLNWVKAKNKDTLKEFENDSDYKTKFEIALEIYQAQDKLPYVQFMDGLLYNFWRDEVHIKGILRRTTVSSYLSDNPAWELVLDLDELSQTESKSWVLQKYSKERTASRMLMFLSDGGTDAHCVREFDLDKKIFIEDGFNLPQSKGDAQYIDKDTLIISRDFGHDSLTDSGYPRTLKKWKRGTLISDAKTMLSIPKENVFVWAVVDYDDEKLFEVYCEGIDFFSYKVYCNKNDELIKLDLPGQVDVLCIFNGELVFKINEEWKGISSGSLLSISLSQISTSQELKPSIIMESTQKYFVEHVVKVKNFLIVVGQSDIKSCLHEITFANNYWQAKSIDIDDNSTIDYVTGDEERDSYVFTTENFISPRQLYYKQAGVIKKVMAKSEKLKFKNQHLEINQYFVASKDQTQIPYFVVHPREMRNDGKNPTILTGYGGFQISRMPSFSNIIGKLWLENGGVYVLANIRGGGEYGPSWHQAALKNNRHKAYEDFFAVANDLVKRGITTPDHLGARGGSNGGLLMGVCLTQKPELFKAIHCACPLLDMLRYHKLLAGASWVGEYGSPEIKEEREYLKSYSPYHNIISGNHYPKIFFTTSTKDDRVHPGHARKMAARMEEYHHPFYYYENVEGGHAGSADYIQFSREAALVYTYFSKMLN